MSYICANIGSDTGLLPNYYPDQCWFCVYWTISNKNLYQYVKHASLKSIWKCLKNCGHFVLQWNRDVSCGLMAYLPTTNVNQNLAESSLKFTGGFGQTSLNSMAVWPVALSLNWVNFLRKIEHRWADIWTMSTFAPVRSDPCSESLYRSFKPNQHKLNTKLFMHCITIMILWQ